MALGNRLFVSSAMQVVGGGDVPVPDELWNDGGAGHHDGWMLDFHDRGLWGSRRS